MHFKTSIEITGPLGRGTRSLDRVGIEESEVPDVRFEKLGSAQHLGRPNGLPITQSLEQPLEPPLEPSLERPKRVSFASTECEGDRMEGDDEACLKVAAILRGLGGSEVAVVECDSHARRKRAASENIAASISKRGRVVAEVIPTRPDGEIVDLSNGSAPNKPQEQGELFEVAKPLPGLGPYDVLSGSDSRALSNLGNRRFRVLCTIQGLSNQGQQVDRIQKVQRVCAAVKEAGGRFVAAASDGTFAEASESETMALFDEKPIQVPTGISNAGRVGSFPPSLFPALATTPLWNPFRLNPVSAARMHALNLSTTAASLGTHTSSRHPQVCLANHYIAMQAQALRSNN